MIQVGFSFDAYCMAAQIYHTVEHNLLQYYRAEIFCFLLLLYSISYIVDLSGFPYYYNYTFVHMQSKLTSLLTGYMVARLLLEGRRAIMVWKPTSLRKHITV